MLQPLSEIQFRVALGMLQHMRARRRTVKPYAIAYQKCTGLAARLGYLVAPWSIDEYPGRLAVLAHILGVKKETASKYRQRNAISLPALDRAITWLRNRAAELLALADEMERAAQDQHAAASPIQGWFRVNASDKEKRRAAQEMAARRWGKTLD